MLDFMKKLIQLRKSVSDIIQHGKYSLEEIKSDVVFLEWDYDGQKVRAIFNQSKENYMLESDSATLTSHCQVSDRQLLILPKGFVIFAEDLETAAN
jgi:neopullulanase